MIEQPQQGQTVDMQQFAFAIIGMIAELLKGAGGTAYQIADVSLQGQTHKLAIIAMAGVNAAVIEDLVKAKVEKPNDPTMKMLEDYKSEVKQ